MTDIGRNRIRNVLIGILMATIAFQWFALFAMSRDARSVTMTAVEQADENLELAMTWKDIATTWHAMYEQVADHCTTRADAR